MYIRNLYSVFVKKLCMVKTVLIFYGLACGGLINDDSGIIYPPGYPNQIIPYVTCQWDFRAGIKNRYVLEIQFIKNVKYDKVFYK